MMHCHRMLAEDSRHQLLMQAVWHIVLCHVKNQTNPAVAVQCQSYDLYTFCMITGSLLQFVICVSPQPGLQQGSGCETSWSGTGLQDEAGLPALQQQHSPSLMGAQQAVDHELARFGRTDSLKYCPHHSMVTNAPAEDTAGHVLLQCKCLQCTSQISAGWWRSEPGLR